MLAEMNELMIGILVAGLDKATWPIRSDLGDVPARRPNSGNREPEGKRSNLDDSVVFKGIVELVGVTSGNSSPAEHREDQL